MVVVEEEEEEEAGRVSTLHIEHQEEEKRGGIFQMRIAPSSPTDTRFLWSGDTATRVIAPLCPMPTAWH